MTAVQHSLGGTPKKRLIEKHDKVRGNGSGGLTLLTDESRRRSGRSSLPLSLIHSWIFFFLEIRK
jgi:hypothetical protein